jgi:hypothetical protein
VLKLNYEHLRFENFCPGLYPGPLLNRGRRTRREKGREGRGEKEGRGRRERKEDEGREWCPLVSI